MGGIVSSKSRLTTEKKAELLRQTPFFLLFDDESLLMIAKYFEYEEIAQGENVKDQSFIVVVEGELSISTLVPNSKGGNGKAHVSELLCVKKKGDFFSKAGRELTMDNSIPPPGGKMTASQRSKASMEKVIQAFDFTSVRALTNTSILKLGYNKKNEYLANCSTQVLSMFQKVLNTDMGAILRPIPFLKGVEGTKLTSLAELFTYEAHEAGKVVIQEGTRDENFYLVLAGKLEITATIDPIKLKARSVTRFIKGEGSIDIEGDDNDIEDSQVSPDETGEEEENQDAAAPVAGTDGEEEKGEENGSTEPEGEGEEKKVFSLDPHKKKAVVGGEEPQTPKKKPVPILRPMPSMRLLRKSSSKVQEGDNIKLAELGASSSFGEMALLLSMPRTATVTTKEKTLLAKLTKSDFDNFVRLAPSVQEAMTRETKLRLVSKLYAFKLPFFAGIEKSKLLELADVSNLCEYEPGDTIMEQGGNCGSFYILIHGMVDVIKNDDHVVRLAKGSYFGEISMLTGKPHLASIKAFSEVVLLSVTLDSFQKFFNNSPEMLAEFEMRVLGPNGLTLNHVLRHALGYELFHQHLKNEYTQEHLEFWDAVNKFHASTETDKDAIAASAKAIIEEYIGAEAKRTVNISASMSQTVLDKFAQGDVPKTLFDEAQLEIYNLMKRDNFSRFKKTVLFQELLDNLSCYDSGDGIDLSEEDLKRAEYEHTKG